MYVSGVIFFVIIFPSLYTHVVIPFQSASVCFCFLYSVLLSAGLCLSTGSEEEEGCSAGVCLCEKKNGKGVAVGW